MKCPTTASPSATLINSDTQNHSNHMDLRLQELDELAHNVYQILLANQTVSPCFSLASCSVSYAIARNVHFYMV